HVDGVSINDRANRVEKVQVRGSTQARDFLRERIGGKRTGSDDRNLIVGDCRDFFTVNPDQRFARKGVGDRGGKSCASDGQRVSGRNGTLPGDLDQQRSGAAHFFFQQPGRGVFAVGLEGVGAD